MSDIDHWHKLKKKLNAHDTVPLFKEREVWWASIGVNVGHEQNGKNEKFNRPVLIVRKFNKRLFWGVPLSTQMKDSIHYHQFSFKRKTQSALLTQLRLWDGNRLTSRMGRISDTDFQGIRTALRDYLI